MNYGFTKTQFNSTTISFASSSHFIVLENGSLMQIGKSINSASKTAKPMT